jgi:hypothetical protein
VGNAETQAPFVSPADKEMLAQQRSATGSIALLVALLFDVFGLPRGHPIDRERASLSWSQRR